MRKSTIFADAFMDGFTMAGFFNWLKLPGSANRIFAPPAASQETGWQELTFVPASSKGEEVDVAGNLRVVPVSALRAMMALLQKEEEERKTAGTDSERVVHSTTR